MTAVSQTISHPSFRTGWLILILLFMAHSARAQQRGKQSNPPPAARQQQDTGKALIHILNNDYGEFVQGEGRGVQKLMYNVKLRYGSDTLYCDSAFFYTRENSVEAFGDVAIYEADGTKAFAEYMRYTSNNQQVYMRSRNSDVELDDGDGNILWSKEVTYHMQPKIGYYRRGGTLQSGSTIVSSEVGTYHLQTKDARFKKNVVVNDPQYYIRSSDLGYNTQSKIVTFFGPSTVTNNESILKTRSGFYNTIDSTAHFSERSAIWNGSQFIEADTLDYSHRQGGLALAKGQVIALDTAQNATLFCQTATYQEQTQHLYAYGAPLLRTIHGEDSLYIKADTFFSAPVALTDSVARQDSLQTAQKSLQQTAEEIQKQVRQDPLESPDTARRLFQPPTKDQILSLQEEADTLGSRTPADTVDDKAPSAAPAAVKDTTRLPLQHQQVFDSMQSGYANRPEPKDTATLRYFIGYHHVRLFSDSLQGYCDSIRYSQQDSLLRMYQEPLLWPNRSQVAGKEIYLKIDSSSIRELIVPAEGILINRSGPEQADFYNQIQGNTIHGYFRNNQLHRLIAVPHAASIYYVTNDDGAYVGCSKADSREIEILFDTAGHVNKIYYRQDVKQKMTPMKDVNPEEMRLSRFLWQETLRPKRLETFLEGVSKPRMPEWQ